MAGVPLVIGSVEEDVEGERQRYRAFIDYLSKQLTSAEVDDVKLMVFTSIDDMAAAINRSQVDIYIDSPVLATIVSRKAEAEPFLRVWKEGSQPIAPLFMPNVAAAYAMSPTSRVRLSHSASANRRLVTICHVLIFPRRAFRLLSWTRLKIQFLRVPLVTSFLTVHARVWLGCRRDSLLLL